MPDRAVTTKPHKLDPATLARVHITVMRPRLLLFAGLVCVAEFILLTAGGLVPWYFGLFISLVTLTAGLLGQPIRYTKVLSGPKYAAMYNERTVTVDADHYMFEDKAGVASKIPLTSFQSVSILRGYYVLMVTPGQFFAFPVGAFANEADEELFRGYVRAKVPKIVGF